MLRLTRTAIGLLTAQYRSVLRKCWAINVGLFILGTASITTVLSNEALGSIQDNTLLDQGTNGTVYLRNGYGNIGSGLYLDSAIHYLPLSAFAFAQSNDDYHFLYHTSGGASDTPYNITAFLLGGVINLDTAVYNVAASLNNYYRNEDLGSRQVIDFARYFKIGKFGENAQFLNNKSTIFEALATKVPAAELRCKIVNETSKKFAEMPHNSPAGEGTLSAFHRKAESVMDNLSKCRAANDNFIKDATTFLRAI